MGDIKSHAIVGHRVIDALKKTLPDEDYQYIELGNYFTDVSQFRDPTAMQMVKPRLLQIARDKSWWPNIFLDPKVIPWLDELMGTPKTRHGKLSEFFEQVLLAATLTLGNKLRIPDNECLRLFKRYFTQYYPHEHLDYPPALDPQDLVRRHRELRRTRLLGYLEEQLQYVSELLTSVEVQWKNARRVHPRRDAAPRHDVLVELGHALHAVEDYFFHSNFAELYWWRIAEHDHAKTGGNQSWDNWFDLNALDRRKEGIWVRYRRKLYRRLRYPVMHQGPAGTPVPSTSTSLEGKRFVYTGGFGEADLYHTFYGALVGLEQGLSHYGVDSPWSSSSLVLLRTIMTESERRRVVWDEDYLESLIEQHRKQLESGAYPTAIDSRVASGQMSQAAGNVLKKAFEIDRVFSAKHSKTPGLGGFLLHLAKNVQEEADTSDRRSNALDSARHVRDARTENGASGEGIGNHANMAKDSVRSGPFRGEALALAAHASTNLALMMATQVASSNEPAAALWWDGALRHYIRYPRESRGAWEKVVMDRQRPAGAKLANIRHTAGDRPRKVVFPSGHPQIKDRMSHKTRRRLEKRYTDLEAEADRRWAQAK